MTGNFVVDGGPPVSIWDYITVIESRKGTSDDVQQVTSIGGGSILEDTWRLEWEGKISNPMPHDVSQAQMLSELQNIELSSAEVVALPTGGGSGCTGLSDCRTWEIRLPPTGCIGVGCPLLVARGEGTTHSGILNVTRIAHATLTHISGGSLVLDGLPIPHDVSEEELVETLYPLHGMVAVTQMSTGPLDSYAWDITFKDRGGDIPLLDLNIHEDMQKSSSGEVSAVIEEINKGTGPCCVAGEFRVSLEGIDGGSGSGGHEDGSVLLMIGDEDDTISMSLSNLLNSHPNVSMFGDTSISYSNRLDGGFIWDVTFLDSSAPLPPPLFYIVEGSDVTVINGTATANTVLNGARSEVQRIEISASSDIIQAKFTLSLNGKITSPMDATTVLNEALEQAFINDLGVLVKVSTASLHSGSGYAWDISYEGAVGGAKGQVVSCSFSGNTVAEFTDDVTCNSYLVVESSSQSLDGVFVLEFNGEETVPLAVNPAPLPQDIAASLSELSNIARADVTGGSEVDGIRYQITFTGSSVSSGELPYLGFGKATTLYGTGVTTSVRNLKSGCKGGEGHFWSIGIGGTVSPLPLLPWNASSDVVAQATEAIPGIGKVSVTDELWYSSSDEHQQYRSWLVTFLERVGNMELLQAVDSSGNDVFEASTALFSVERVQNGTRAVRGYWKVSFTSSSASTDLSWDESAIELEAAIENLTTVGDVSVTRTEGDGNDNGSIREWFITFTTMGIPENLGDLPLLSVDASMLTGAEIYVSKVSSGCCTLQVSLNGGKDWTPPQVSGRFRFQDTYVASSVVPDSGPISGRTRIMIYGGPFIADEPLTCTFGLAHRVPSEWISLNEISCTTPPYPSAGSVVLSLNSDSVYSSPAASPLFSILHFIYFDDVTLASVIPTRGEWDGPGTAVYLKVAAGAFPMNSIVQCMMNIFVPIGASNNSHPLEFAVTVEAEPLFGDFGSFIPPVAYKCTIPGIPSEMSEEERAVSLNQMKSNSLMPYAVISLTANGGLDTTSPLLHFNYFSSVIPLRIFPPLGPVEGGTVVTIHGEGFLPSDGTNLLGCVFGDNNDVVMNVRPAEHLSLEVIRCTSPSSFMAPRAQVLEISAAGPFAYPEIQAVTVTWDQGLVAEEFGVSLTIDIEDGCRIREIPIVSEDGQEDLLSLALEEALNITGCAGGTLVTTTSAAISTTWTITFVELQGALPELLGASIFGPGTSFFSVEVSRIQSGSVGGARPEVQRIQMSWPSIQSDVQKLTISLVDPSSPEVQRVTLSATDLVFGTFSLMYGVLGPSPAVPANASGEVLAAALQRLGDEIGSVVASRNPIGVAGYEWTLTFLDVKGGDRPECAAINDGSLTSMGSITLETSTQHNGSPPLTGEWSISSSESPMGPSASLIANATALQVKEALETVLGYNVVEVRAEIDTDTYGQGGGSSFLVTFSPIEGDLPDLAIDISQLEGGQLVLPTVTSITDGIGPALCQFQIIENGESTDLLHCNATSLELKNAILQLSGINAPVHVRRAVSEEGGNMEWTITFSHSDGDLPEIDIDIAETLEDVIAVPPTDITVITLQDGDYSPFAGEVVLQYLGKRSDSFSVGIDGMPSVTVMESMIDTLVGDVAFNVSTSPIEDGGGRVGSSYLIEFFGPVQDIVRLSPEEGSFSGAAVKLYPMEDHLVTTPNTPEAIVVPLSVTLNGGADVDAWMNAGSNNSGLSMPLSFQYFQWPSVSAIEPHFGPTEGGTDIVVTLQGPLPSQTSVELLKCRFRLQSSVSSGSDSLPIHDEIVSIVNVQSLAVSLQPDGNITTTVTCSSPLMPPGTVRAVLIDVSLNGGVDFPPSTTISGGNGSSGEIYSQAFTYMNITDSMALASLVPSSGPSHGGSLVTIQFPSRYAAATAATEKQLEESGQLWCAFGDTLVSATIENVPTAEGTNDNSIWNNHPIVVSCVSPPLLDVITYSEPILPHTVPLEVSFNGGADFTKGMATWTYDMDVVVSALLPETGPVGGGTLIHVEGGPFPETQGIFCRFGSALHTKATRLGNHALMCVSPEFQGGVPEKQAVHLASMAYTPAVSCINVSTATNPSSEKHIISTSSLGLADEVQLVQLLWNDIDEVQSISLGQDLEAPRIISLQASVATYRPTIIEISISSQASPPILLLSLDALGGKEGAISDTWGILL